MKESSLFTSIKNTLKAFSQKKLFFQYFKLCFIIIFIPVVIISGLIFFNQAQTSNTASMHEAEKRFTIIKDSIENIFESTNKNANYLISNNYVKSFIYLDKITNTTSVTRSRELLSNSVLLDDTILCAEVYSFKNDYVLSSRASEYLKNGVHAPWFDHYKKTGLTNFLCSAKNHSGQHVIYACYGIFQKETLTGFVVFQLDPAKVIAHIEDNDKFYLLNNDGTTLYSSDNKNFTKTKYHHFEGNLFNNIVFSMDIPSTSTIKSPISFFFLVIIFLIILMLITIMLSLYISNRFYSSISKIFSYFHRLDKNSDIPTYEAVDEFLYIQSSLTKLSASNTKMENELLDMANQLREAQNAVLQSQFTPHFLFNTLNLVSMKALALTKSDNDISKIVTLLSELLYTSLNSKQNIISVKEELDFAEKYIEIQKLRYDNSFSITWDIDSQLYKLYTLKLILQPIIENALNHGILKLPTNIRGELLIRAELSTADDSLIFYIINNGVITEEDLINIKTSLADTKINFNSSHIGIGNVHQRIKILFGNKYGCDAFVDESGRTVFKISLPIVHSPL